MSESPPPQRPRKEPATWLPQPGPYQAAPARGHRRSALTIVLYALWILARAVLLGALILVGIGLLLFGTCYLISIGAGRH